ncbi:MAG: hypothetical protein IMF06_02710 [Proteobacteria bacterium]|nr:hypothetical protein [Pseudomonadota bacterium]
MKAIINLFKVLLIVGVVSVLSGCDDPQVYGSVGVSSGYGGYNHGRYGGHHGRYGGSGVRTSISVGGRIY